MAEMYILLSTAQWDIKSDGLEGLVYALDATITYTPLTGTLTALDAEVAYDLAVVAPTFIIPATGPAPRIEAPVLPNVTASLMPAMATTGTPGVIGIIGVTALASANAGLARYTVGDIYWRIWVVPAFLRPQNPERSVDIPFIVWQAYPYDNSLVSIGGSGQTGLTLDLSAPGSWAFCEERTVNLQIGPTAPINISAIYLFNFTTGQGVFLFETTIATWLWAVPEVPVMETWSWLSDVIQAWDNTEQRIMIRKQPRRSLSFTLALDDDAARARELECWYSSLSGTIVIPFYQYATRTTAASASGTSKLFFDPATTDVRDGEFVVIYRPATNTSYLLKLDEVVADGATTDTSLTMDIEKYDVLAPASTCRLEDKTGPVMTSVSGELAVRALVTEPRVSFARPGSLAVIAQFDGLNVLESRPLIPADEMVDAHVTFIDNNSGLVDAKSSWAHALISGRRMFKIPRILEPVQFDYWRDFLDEAGGQQVSFLMSTWRRDLVLAEIPGPSDPQLIIEGTTYGSQFWIHDTYKRLQFETSEGDIIWRKVTAVDDYPGGLTLITLNEALPADSIWGSEFNISFLNRVRLASDEVQLTHFGLDTMLEFSIRTTSQ